MTDTDGPYSLLPIEGGEVRLLLGAEDDPATVDNCDGFVVDAHLARSIRIQSGTKSTSPA